MLPARTMSMSSLKRVSTAELIPIGDYLKSTPVTEIPKERDPFLLREDMEPGTAFKKMGAEWVRACPVLDLTGSEIIGSLDLRETSKYVIAAYKSGVSNGKSPTGGRRRGSLVFGNAEWKEQATTIAEMARKRPFVAVEPDASVFDIAVILSGGSHIVGVKGGPPETGGLSTIITQAMLFNFCAPKIMDLKVDVGQMMSSPAVCVKTTDPALKAFETMASKNISAVAVVDSSDGAIVHHTSTSDIKMLFNGDDTEEMKMMDTIEEFLVKLRASQTRGKTKIPVSTCQKTDTLGSVLRRISKTGYHHVWVVNQSRNPVGVLSLTDVFRRLAGGEKADKCTVM